MLRIPFFLKCAAGTSARIYISPPTATGKWKVRAVSQTPNEASATNASNYMTEAFKVGSDTLAASKTTNSSGGAALVQGTAENLTLTAVGDKLEATQANPFNIVITHSGTGVAVDVSGVVEFEELRA